MARYNKSVNRKSWKTQDQIEQTAYDLEITPDEVPEQPEFDPEDLEII
jgi:hypothetical protein